MMGQYSSPGPVRGVNGPFLLTSAADTARQQLAAWARDDATSSNDYYVNGQGDRTYRNTSLEPLVEPLLHELNLAGCKYTMYRAEDVRLVPVTHPTYAIPINVIAGMPKIQDLTHNIVTLLLGYYYTLCTDVIISPKVDYLVVERGPGTYR
ncbi:uncharacterized protein N7473_004308 [Penicillium subrubescens]|uniref:uncharacterized protein n=1 Tax=Penicillium subrubescens TaxID=1316194 RepID=UPI002544F722|nr:uncharacterized protein N7473_004308 [Penicillium subrubescens]KAJ5900238.1 hypothetical protein N7473_004308 [Penicillium subrubescens]